MSESSKAAIIVLNWNGWKDTVDCLESLAHLENRRFSIIVCDNASTDDSVARIKSWAAMELERINAGRVAAAKEPFNFIDRSDAASLQQGAQGDSNAIVLIQTGRNGGYAAGNNVGMRHALANGFDYFWVLNNDVEVEPDALTWLIRRMGDDPGIGICGSTLIYHGQRDLVQNLGGAWFIRSKGRGVGVGAQSDARAPIDQAAVEAQLDYVSGASMFVSREFLEKIGLMQEDYFLYYEELDWAARARGLFRLGYAAKSIVYHKVGATIGTNDFGERSALADYYMARSRIRCCARFFRTSLPFVLFDVSRKALRYARRGEWSRAANLARAIVGMRFAGA
ncbi:glycosyltransferase family 2 protein [Terrarubrum flagellatum]|uniref:glycosyltransferase family 2 protein n=1 Tax=Terrirubrum flagellatum TaxID=2895980 RepID=UPI0031454171